MPFFTHKRIEFGDTDMAGIVYFANFFRYMEAAETDFLVARGLNVTWTDAGVRYGFPRVSAACDYVRPARFGEVLTVTVTVEKVGTKSVTYRHDFSLGDDPIAVGRMTTVYCRGADAGGSPHGLHSLAIPDEIRAKLES